jgi:DNA-binding beta-propeller fold protein YncE
MFYRHPQFQFVYRRSWAIRKAWLTRKGSFKKLARNCGGVLFIATVAVLNIVLLPKSGATFVYNASDNLGQTHGSFTNPNFTDGAENGIPASNHVGFSDFAGGTALDSTNHRLFVADTGNNRVMVYSLDSSNHLVGTSASYAIGQPDFANDNQNYLASDCEQLFKLPSQNGLCMPSDVAYDSIHDRLFVLDGGWNRVMVYDLSGGITNGMNASFVLGKANFTASDGTCRFAGTPSASTLCFNNVLQ